jgi:hypothetical protein
MRANPVSYGPNHLNWWTETAKLRQLPASERRELLGILNSETEPVVQMAQAALPEVSAESTPNVPTSSESFNRRKRSETKLKNRNS